MVRITRRQGCVLAAIVVAGALPTLARAQATSNQLGEITVTADRLEEPVNATGSDVTVIPGSEIEKWGANGITEVLQAVVGVNVVPTGGPNTVTSVYVRGADPSQVLVMIDGIPIGNVAGTDGSVDFSNLSAIDIDRIEIVRGPQSSLYGSDAMGGVINIITKKGKKGEHHTTLTIQGGSYGTIQGTAAVSGSTDNWTYVLGATDVYTEGFPTYGYRVNGPLFLSNGLPLPPLPSIMPANKGGANGNFTYTFGPNASIDFGFDVFENNLQYSNPYALVPVDVFSSYNSSTTWIANGYVRANATTGILTNHLTVFGNQTDMAAGTTEGCFNAEFVAFNCNGYYRGSRFGAEYQGNLAFGPYGSLIVGARNMTETAGSSQSPNPGDGSFIPASAQQTTNSVYAQYNLPLFSRLDLTFGGRVDAIQDGPTFVTGRTTAAYHIDETGTKLRAAFGNGAKAPTLYQRFSQYGTADLLPQSNVGGEVGIDQNLFNDRLTLSATAYNAYYRNLIAFASVSSCTLAQDAIGGCYYNIGTAQTRGVEVTADVAVVPDVLHVRGGYTYNLAVNTQTDMQEFRVPLNSGYISAVYTGVPNLPNLSIEPRLLLVGPALDENFLVSPATNVVLAGYARLDCIVNYKINDTFTAFVRGENLTDTKYQTVYNYSTPGASVYAGLTAKF
jgi:vitamin B12 transporter